jgi:hypothetical protein
VIEIEQTAEQWLHKVYTVSGSFHGLRLFAALTWPYSSGWGYYPGGGSASF